MIRQLGLPTWFISLSAADTKWHDLIVMLGKLNEKKDYTNDLLDGKLDWEHVTKLVSSDPVTCARYFNNRTETFIRDVLGSPHNPIHEVTDNVYRVEFQHRGSPHIHMLIWTKMHPNMVKIKKMRYCSSTKNMYRVQLIFQTMKNNMLICSDIDTRVLVVKKGKLFVALGFQYHQCQKQLF